MKYLNSQDTTIGWGTWLSRKVLRGFFMFDFGRFALFAGVLESPYNINNAEILNTTQNPCTHRIRRFKFQSFDCDLRGSGAPKRVKNDMKRTVNVATLRKIV